MLINTAVMGQMDVQETHVFHLPDGLYGFEGVSDYALITRQEDDLNLMWFQAVESAAPCFVVFNPFEIIHDYTPKVDESDLKRLDATSVGELDFLVIAVVPEDVSQISVNLKSPIVLNQKSRTARQVILQGDYPIKYYLFSEE